MNLEDRISKLEAKFEKLNEDTIRNDERYNTMLTLISNIQITLDSTVKEINNMAKELAVNTHKTNKAAGFINGVSYGKIGALLVATLTVIQFIRGN